MTRRALVWLVTLAIIFAAVYVVFINFLGVSSVNVKLNNAPEGTSVFIDDRRLVRSGSGDYTVDVKAGKHRLYIISSGNQDYVEEFRTVFRSSLVLSPALEPINAEAIARDILLSGDITPGSSISNAKLYGKDKDWLVFYSGVSGSDGAVNVAKFSPDSRKWEIIASGTTIYLQDNRNLAPPELIEDIELVLED